MADVDDLFGDGDGDGTSMMEQADFDMDNTTMDLPAAAQGPTSASAPYRPPLPSELRMRLDQLKIRGCCQMIAWSRCGTVASISPDGKAVELRFLRIDSDTGEWGLSEPTTSELVHGIDNIPLIHLAWAATKNPELAVFDVLGRVTILSFYHILNGPAIKENGSDMFRYESSFVHAFPPYHPHPGRSALLCITDNGLLKLFYPGSKAEKVEETTHELESIIVSEDQITHASVCSDKTGLMAVIATASKQLRVIQINIDWGISGEGGNKLPINPMLTEQHVAATTWYQGTNKSCSPLDHAMAKITHLEILASLTDPNTKKWANGIVMSVRSYAPSDPSPHYEPQSVLDRWEIVQEQQTPLLKAFESLGTRRPNASQNSFRLNRLEPVVFNRVIVNIHQMQLGRVLFITFADGSVEYRDRFTMELLYNDSNYTKVHSLHQTGMQFEDQSSCLNVAFSPTGCSMVQICNDKKIKWRKLHTNDDIGENMKTDQQYAAIIAGLTLAAGSCSPSQASFEDVLAIARTMREKPNFIADFIQETTRMLKMVVDYSEESHHDSLVRNYNLQLALSMLCHLGFNGQYKKRSFSGKIAKLSLHARSVIVIVSISSNTPPHLREKLSPLDEPEVVDALTGCHKWSIDLMCWLLDSLFELLQDKEFLELLQQPRGAAEIGNLLQKRNNIALHFVLSSSSRGFMVAILRRLQHMDGLSKKATSFYERNYNPNDSQANMALYRAYSRMHKVMESSLFKFEELERFFSSIAADIRTSYQHLQTVMIKRQQQLGPHNQPPEQAMQQIEAGMKSMQSKNELGLLISPHIPQVLIQVVKKLFATDLPNLRAKMDQKKLLFHDYTLIEAEDSPEALLERKNRGVLVDSFKHVLLPSAEVLAQKKTVQGENYQGHDEAAIEFADSSLLSFLIPAATGASLEDIFSKADTSNPLGLLHSIPQRKSLFFDETLEVLLVLRTPWADEETLRAHLKRLVIILEAQIVNKPDRGGGPVPHDLIFSGTLEDNDDPFIIVDEDVDSSEEGDAQSRTIAGTDTDTNIDANANAKAQVPLDGETLSQSKEDRVKHIYAVWKMSVFLARPRIRLQQPTALFSASASLKPLEPSVSTASTLATAHKSRNGYLQSGMASGMNLLSAFATDDGLGQVVPRLSALRVSRVAPLTNPRDLMRPLRAQAAVSLSIVPAVHTRVRFARPNTLPATPDLIASLEVDFTGMFTSPIKIAQIDLSVQDGSVICLSDAVDGLTPDGETEGMRNPARDLDIAVRAVIDVNATTKPELVMQWSTPIDFTIPVNPGFGLSAAQPPIQRSHKPSQLSISGAGDGASLISPSVSRPDSLPAHDAKPTLSVPDLGVTVTFAAPPGPVYKGQEFAWSVYVLNRSTEKTDTAARKMALVAVPRRRRNEIRIARPPSMSRRPDAAQIADAVMDENVVHALQYNSLVDTPDVVCLSADTRVGPLAPGSCHVTELRFLALKEGILGIEAVRVVDLATQEHVEIRELPLIVVKGAKDGEDAMDGMNFGD
ncbi:Mediator of RNA polymerase II transcription subunit 16 [Ceratocystis platani]|uniref:Mediator of RNA polymerase II transcription subunit 16 n=1 Tax=Ceratocystis fimbriata f. sp. platani TaxID=88771 RepID=A0A0F8AYD1_CERFI|nr:Mediator of RNA polymerase II transcription subunit 16 [Ceratocystis platani]